jgi:hypothetical protein
MKLFLFSLFTLTVSGVDIVQIAKIPIPPEYENQYFQRLEHRLVNASLGSRFHIRYDNNNGKDLVVDINGLYYLFDSRFLINKIKTNIVGTLVENGVLKILQDEIRESHSFSNDGWLVYKTFSKNGFVSLINEAIQTTTYRYKVSFNENQIVNGSSNYSYRYHLIKYNSSGKAFSTNSFDGKYVPSSNWSGYHESPFVSIDVKDGFFYVSTIKIDSNDVSLNTTTLKINRIDSNGINASIESNSLNPIKIQTSENIQDWKDLNIILNPSIKEFIIPISKQQDFIRAIE